MIDLKSIMGYGNNSPFRNNPYLDINTPEGIISMQDTPIDLLGVDNTGMVKEMKAYDKNPYKFKGDVVREIPLNKNPYMQQGGMTQQLISYLFDDDDEQDAPVQKPVQQEEDNKDELALEKNEKLMKRRQEEDLALSLLDDEWSNPYRRNNELLLDDNLGGTGQYTGRNQDLYSASLQLEGQKYKFSASGNPGEGGVDCSGAVCKIVGLPRMTSEQILTGSKNFRLFGDVSELKEGTVLGFDTGPTSFDKNRKYGIDHTGVIVKNPGSGELEYKHSAGSTGFKTLTIEEMLKKYRNAKNIFVGDYK